MAYLTAEEHDLNNHIAVCSCGYPPTDAVNRMWTKEILRPYVYYLHNQQAIDHMFGGLLFETDMTGKGGQLSARSIGFGVPDDLEDWQQVGAHLFVPEHNISAALELSRDLCTHTLDIWVALPYPFAHNHSSDTRDLARDVFWRTDRIKWWIARFFDEWKAACTAVSDHRARLCGFAWTKSSLAPNDDLVIRDVSEFIHESGFKLFWCHNFGTTGATNVTELGFDFAFTRATYTGIEPRGIEWIRYTAAFAAHYHTGMTIWGEQRFSPYHALDFLNMGNESFKQAFQLYELPFRAVYDWYCETNPMYVYLYAYLKQAFTKIVYPGCSYE